MLKSHINIDSLKSIYINGELSEYEIDENNTIIILTVEITDIEIIIYGTTAATFEDINAYTLKKEELVEGEPEGKQSRHRLRALRKQRALTCQTMMPM